MIDIFRQKVSALTRLVTSPPRAIIARYHSYSITALTKLVAAFTRVVTALAASRTARNTFAGAITSCYIIETEFLKNVESTLKIIA